MSVKEDRNAGALDAAFVRRWLEEAARGMREQRDYLTQLDAAIGDADHGINMDRGFATALKLEQTDPRSASDLLEVVGTTLILSVGGAAGPLYGSSLRHMGAALVNRTAFDGEDLLVALRAGLDEIRRLGAASEGDKTIVDALAPAIAAFEHGLRAGRPFLEVVVHAREAAEEGMRATVPMQARKGRASYLGPRSVGHQDPGATSTAILFLALERAAADDREPEP